VLPLCPVTSEDLDPGVATLSCHFRRSGPWCCHSVLPLQKIWTLVLPLCPAHFRRSGPWCCHSVLPLQKIWTLVLPLCPVTSEDLDPGVATLSCDFRTRRSGPWCCHSVLRLQKIWTLMLPLCPATSEDLDPGVAMVQYNDIPVWRHADPGGIVHLSGPFSHPTEPLQEDARRGEDLRQTGERG
jgi:hypothetical protein